jgi:hypothetical protein
MEGKKEKERREEGRKGRKEGEMRKRGGREEDKRDGDREEVKEGGRENRLSNCSIASKDQCPYFILFSLLFSCWLHTEKGFVWAFLGPICTIFSVSDIIRVPYYPLKGH